MSGTKFIKAIFSVETNKTVSERSRLDVNHTTTKTAVRNAGGFNDDSLGAIDKRNKCSTCHATKELCYGHHGSYELRYPIIQPVTMSELLAVLKVICHKCYRPRSLTMGKTLKQLATTKNACIYCKEPQSEVSKNKTQTGIMVTHGGGGKKHQMSNKKIYTLLRAILPADAKALGIQTKLDSYLLRRIDITPVSVRVELPRGNKQSQVPAITAAYKNIIDINVGLNLDHISSDAPELLSKIDEMTAEYCKGTVGLQGHPSLNLAVSLKDKEGLIRSRIMGRRVSHIARSVITGNTNHKPHEIGLHVNIANAICIPERVTEFNINRMRSLVANGDIWPGAKYVSLKTGSKDHLGHNIMKKIRIYESNKKDITISVGDVVFRHLLDGDLALLNRQPTLMAQSMAGMQIRISFTSFTITLNPGSCAPFNADFDGDNMNVSFASNPAANNELRTVSFFGRWIENHQSPSCTLGAFQDTVVGSAMFSMEKKIPDYVARKICADPNLFLAKSDTGKQVSHFTGNQLLSKIIPENINLNKKSSWDKQPLEIVKGNIVSGVLDKGNAGQSVEGSLFHEIIISNGSDNALEVLSNLQEMVKRFQGYYTVSTIGIKDILFDYDAIREIRDYIKSCIAKVECLYANAYNGRLAIPAGKTLAETVENEEFAIMNTAATIGKIVTGSLNKLDNNILRLIETGSKGNMSAAVSIFGTVGYITVDGGRMPYNLGNRCYLSSPNFPIDPVHKGCVLNPFRTGISNREIFAAATDARESFISNALNTAIAGTFTKNLNKCMDSMVIDYFYGVVTSNKMIQSLCYGTGFALHRLVKVNARSIGLPKKKFLERYGLTQGDALTAERDTIRTAFIERGVNPLDPIELPFDITREITNAVNNFPELVGKGLTTSTVQLRLDKVINRVSKIFYNQYRIIDPTPDMVAALRMLSFTIRVELTQARLEALKISDSLLDIILAGIMPALIKALVQPCEAAGVLLSYILGEPLTQYSLDSKHRSGGAGGQNLDAMVRIKEIFVCKPAVGKLKSGKMTPAMEMPLMHIHIHEDEQENIPDIINELEMSTLHKITRRVDILFETKNKSTAYPTDNKEGAHGNSGFINWSIRYELDNDSVLKGGYNIAEVLDNLASEEPNLQFEYLKRGNTRAIRVYIKETEFKNVVADIKRYRDEKLVLAVVQNNPMLLLEPLSDFLLGIKIRGMQNIIRASRAEKKEIFVDPKTDEVLTRTVPYIILNGFNSKVLFKDYVDEEKSWTNSIMDTNAIYGLPAARNRLIEELQGTISKYTKHHCSVLADQMASSGKITTIHRNGIIARERKNIMLLAYERGPFKTFVDAGIKGVTQKIAGPTPSLMTGQRLDAGTGKVVLVTRD